ncbi:MAG: hypothetical protein ACI379_02280 [Nocardioides sp.]|uniref:hypothetical protein n=1 Tax=Nocardioides sp. TaxID=35761 RepID=UPI003EFE114E
MRISRVTAGLVTAGLLGLAPVAVTAPAHAADYTTAVQVGAQYAALTYGTAGYVDAAAYVPAASAYVPTGTLTLEASTNQGQSWTALSTLDVNPSDATRFNNVKPQQNTTYRVSYSGGVYGSDTFQASTSATRTVKVARKVTFPKKNTFTMKGKVTPKYANKKIVITVSKRKTSGFKKFKTIKTNGQGAYKIAMPKKRGTFYYRFRTVADKQYIAGGFNLKLTYTVRYRRTAPGVSPGTSTIAPLI